MNIRVTLADVANSAHVSEATASLALNGHPRISTDTSKRVLEAAHSLGYRADPLARQLRNCEEREPLIALVTNTNFYNLRDHHRPLTFFTNFTLGFIERLSELRSPLVVVSEKNIEGLSQVPIDAVFLMLVSEPIDSNTLPFGVPIVAGGVEATDLQATARIFHPYDRIADEVMNLLADNGAETVGLITRAGSFRYSTEIEAEYRNRMLSSNQQPLVRVSEGSANELEEHAYELTTLGVEAIFQLVGEAQPVVEGITRAGRSVADDVQHMILAEGGVEALYAPQSGVVSMEGLQSGREAAEYMREIALNQAPNNTWTLPYSMTSPKRRTSEGF